MLDRHASGKEYYYDDNDDDERILRADEDNPVHATFTAPRRLVIII
jgi:hypothetical protein